MRELFPDHLIDQNNGLQDLSKNRSPDQSKYRNYRFLPKTRSAKITVYRICFAFLEQPDQADQSPYIQFSLLRFSTLTKSVPIYLQILKREARPDPGKGKGSYSTVFIGYKLDHVTPDQAVFRLIRMIRGQNRRNERKTTRKDSHAKYHDERRASGRDNGGE